MADQPVTTEIDNSEIALRNCLFDSKTVTVPATTTYTRGTVLGILTATGFMSGCESDSSTGTKYPRVILMEELANVTGAPVDLTHARVLLSGEVDADLLVFANGTDTLATQIDTDGIFLLDALKSESIDAVSASDFVK